MQITERSLFMTGVHLFARCIISLKLAKLIGKRQIKMENSVLPYGVDSSLTIQDESLLQTLTDQLNDKMKTNIQSGLFAGTFSSVP